MGILMYEDVFICIFDDIKTMKKYILKYLSENYITFDGFKVAALNYGEKFEFVQVRPERVKALARVAEEMKNLEKMKDDAQKELLSKKIEQLYEEI